MSEETEAVLSLQEQELLEMADAAKQVAAKAKDVPKSQDDTAGKVTIIKEVEKKIEEIKDEVVPNSEYESLTPVKDDIPTKSNPVEELHRPVRDQGH